MAGMVISNGAASFVTDVSPEARRARIARRVGSASAAKPAQRAPSRQCSKSRSSIRPAAPQGAQGNLFRGA